MNILQIQDINMRCAGCFACYNACPCDAIEMQLNNEGFYYPTVISSSCIDCGKCCRACMLTDCQNNEDTVYSDSVYTLIGEDAIRKKCSSGGAFYYVAKTILDKNGVIYGAAYHQDTHEVVHTSTYEMPLDEILRSKYVQSNVGMAYKNVKKQLQQGVDVCFCGTPCQVIGLKKFLGKEYENLTTVDFLCHGVPSTGVFKKTLELYEKREGSKIVQVTFREKDKGWRNQCFKLYFENGVVRTELWKNTPYCYLFLHNITLRKSCYTCAVQARHESDLTLMDFWPVKNDDDMGVSAVCVNTDKGEHIMADVARLIPFHAIDKSQVYYIYEKHADDKSYRKAFDGRNRFFQVYADCGVEKASLRWYRMCKLKNEAKRIVFKFLLPCRTLLYRFLRRK